MFVFTWLSFSVTIGSHIAYAITNLDLLNNKFVLLTKSSLWYRAWGKSRLPYSGTPGLTIYFKGPLSLKLIFYTFNSRICNPWIMTKNAEFSEMLFIICLCSRCCKGNNCSIPVSCPCLSIFMLVFYVVLVSSYRLCCLPFPSCSVLEFFDGWQILIDYQYASTLDTYSLRHFSFVPFFSIRD